GPGPVQHNPSFIETADVDRNRAGVDTDHPRHVPSVPRLSDELPREVGDRLGVEHQVITLEELCDARLVELGLEASNPERTVEPYAIPLRPAVVQLDPLDPQRRHS